MSHPLKRDSSRKQIYSPQDKIETKRGYRPANCGETRRVISDLGMRTAYRQATDYIDEDPNNNCCTIESDDDIWFKLYMWKATTLPVKLTKDKSMTFLCFKDLKYLKL